MIKKYPTEIRQMISYSVLFTISFIIIEGLLAPITRWGRYSVGTILIWNTPYYLLFIWFTVGLIVSFIYEFLNTQISLSNSTKFASVFLIMFVLTFMGEKLGAILGLWEFTHAYIQLIDIPVWVPVSYATGFATNFMFYHKKFSGLSQSLFIGIYWILFSSWI